MAKTFQRHDCIYNNIYYIISRASCFALRASHRIPRENFEQKDEKEEIANLYSEIKINGHTSLQHWYGYLHSRNMFPMKLPQNAVKQK